MRELPRIGVTLGDACGVGPEIILKAFRHPSIYDTSIPFVIGCHAILERAATFIDAPPPIRCIEHPQDACSIPGELQVLDLANLDPSEISIGQISARAGEAAYQYIVKAVELALAGEIGAIVTAPINKAALHRAGHRFPGHTELLAHLTNTPDVVMMLAGRRVRIAYVTTHCALSEVSHQITQQKIVTVLRIARENLLRLGIARPRLAVCALNPHAGEEGAFGDEERRIIVPAIREAREAGWQVEGPYPADTLFVKVKTNPWDAIVVMYHDQGNIPIKLLEFGQVVNITLGLPIVRTSVDHGTAFDIAGQGVASEESLLVAMEYGARLAR